MTPRKLSCYIALVGCLCLFFFSGITETSSSYAASQTAAPMTTASLGSGAVSLARSVSISQNPSKVKVLASGQNGAEDMALSGGYVYWYDFGSGQLNKVSESGGKVITLLTVGNPTHSAVFGVAASGGFVFWGLGNFSTNTGYLYKTNATTGQTTTLYTTNSIYAAVSPTVVGKHIYFLSSYTTIETIRTNGKGLKTILANPSPCPWTLAYSKGYVYWYDLCDGYVGKVSATGGSGTILSPPLGNSGSGWNGVKNMIVVGSEIYWTHNNGGNGNDSLYSVTTSGTNFTHLYGITTGQDFAGVSYYNGNVIFAGPNDIYSIPHSGGTPKVIVSMAAFSVIVHKADVYFTANTEVAKAPA